MYLDDRAEGMNDHSLVSVFLHMSDHMSEEPARDQTEDLLPYHNNTYTLLVAPSDCTLDDILDCKICKKKVLKYKTIL